MDQYDVDKIDPDGQIRAWVKDCFVVDSNSQVLSTDLLLAYQAKFRMDKDINPDMESTTFKQLACLIQTNFTKQLLVILCNDKNGFVGSIDTLRWSKLPPSPVGYRDSASILGRVTCSEKSKQEAHKLLGLSKKERAKAWLSMLYMKDESIIMSLRSLWQHYTASFARSRDTHILLDEAEFLQVVKKTFRGTEEVEISENYTVIRSIGPQENVMPADEYLRFNRMQDFYRLVAKGPILFAPHPNPFNRSLLEHPMLALPLRSRLRTREDAHTGQDQRALTDASALPGPMIQRLHRRAQNPPLPHGDVEPGFPGVSMKAEQKRYKRKSAIMPGLATDSAIKGPPI